MNPINKSLEWAPGRTISLETGKLAKQADGSVVLRVDDTMLMATIVANKKIDLSRNFLPMSVDYKENFAAVGKFPGGFFKRDGRLNEYEILTSRIIDRSMRPLFAEGYAAEIQVLVYVISADEENIPDSYGCIAASAAAVISDIPFAEPVSSVRIVRKDGELVVNPTYDQMDDIELDLMVSGTMDSITMVEGEMMEVSEEVMLEAMKAAHEVIKKYNELQLSLREATGSVPTREFDKLPYLEDLDKKVKEYATPGILNIISKSTSKNERSDAFDVLKDEMLANIIDVENEEDPELSTRLAKEYFGSLKKDLIRKKIINEGVRLDGRKCDEVRDIWCETGYLPRTHGSAIFTRGETQSLTSITLGSKSDEQTIDYATKEGSKKFMLQYNFPAFCTGEVKPMRGPARREIGHGNLAERALKTQIPANMEYTIKVTSDILESNGSSSMATVCAGSLALMDAGIKINKAVSGIAMGLIVEGDKFAVLSDILGDEDHLGDMDFKVTGTDGGLTACQMDIKVRGLSYEILSSALSQSSAGRLHILGEMNKEISVAREDYAPHAPRIVKMTIPTSTIGAVIGPGGKVIQEIQRETDTHISIEEDETGGIVYVSGNEKEGMDRALKWIEGLVAMPEIGETYSAKVKFIKDAGAFVEVLPGKEAWLHISEVAWERTSDIRDKVKMGDTVEVKLIGTDSRTGKFRASIKALLPKPEGYVEPPPRQKDDRRRDNRGGDGGGGDRNNNRR